MTLNTTKVKTGKQDTAKDKGQRTKMEMYVKRRFLWRLPQRTFVRLKKMGVFVTSRR